MREQILEIPVVNPDCIILEINDNFITVPETIQTSTTSAYHVTRYKLFPHIYFFFNLPNNLEEGCIIFIQFIDEKN